MSTNYLQQKVHYFLKILKKCQTKFFLMEVIKMYEKEINENKVTQLKVDLTKKEKEILKNQAAEKGQTISDYVKQTLIYKTIKI